jgi:hypothetical protein
MCTGFEIALLGGMAAGTGITIAGQMQAANAQADLQVAQGKSIAQQAGQEQDAASAQAERIRAAARRQAAEAAAAFSASGVSVDAGTPLKIEQEIQRGGASDALMTILSAERNATTAGNEASALGVSAKATRSAGKTQAMGTLMSSAASMAAASGWRSNGPGFSGTQKPAPISDRSIRVG